MESKYQRTETRPFRARGRGGYQRRGQRTSEGEYSDGKDLATESAAPKIPDTPTTAQFRAIADALDAKNDLFEFLVKNSRDTTIEAKRIIFLLLRCGGLSRESLEVHQILTDAKERLRMLQNSCMRAIAREIAADDPNLFSRAFSPGLQEYVEALTLYHFLDSGILVGLEEAQKDLTFTDENAQQSYQLPVSPVNFLLGIGDLTGELMRYSITQASSATARDAVFQLCDFARAVLVEYQRVPYGIAGKDFPIKLNVMKQSVFKIERVCYQLALRQAENLPALPAYLVKVDSDGPEDAADRFQ
ncbi:putative Translin-associated protein X [Hypsibius exemplaris]|uniref:Translin-associated protein X n=1 Tax=Hypsibius exemplaris TaxID=2072580 RepID=A0A1W0WVQ5_HYPEX|nr:putative Translin-associated protein X [Hypsibius exemplaris]